ncbi:hypothetical protein OOK13_43510 [Streptomyces sp. NBC_00378]|uniref:hypothetical protein n=1 Tax=unclassified Streptomyces TaxID=2593676 RepID=UPI002252B39B|nr:MULTISPECIES: hypothetical protein [unclassified Streptomyces]MCX5115198.1 hypothetical protein [Streptomyces sp. NBC_00378]
MAFFGLVGNDRDLARQYGGESASDKAARKRRESHHRNAAKADRQGQAWEASERARQDGGGWWRRSR